MLAPLRAARNRVRESLTRENTGALPAVEPSTPPLPTLTAAEPLELLPSESVDVIPTVKRPPREYAWDAVVPAAEAPSRKVQAVEPTADQTSRGLTEKPSGAPMPPLPGTDRERNCGPAAS